MSDKELVSVVNLIATPQKFHEKPIAVVGFCVLKFESKGLFLAECDYRNSVTKNALWLTIQLTPEVAQLDQRYGLVEGTFDMESRGHLQMYAGSLRDISRIIPWGTPDP